MEYFRNFIIYLRKSDNTPMKPIFIIRLLMLMFTGILSGLVVDTILPFNFILNLIRGIISIVTGVAGGSYVIIVLERIRRIQHLKNTSYVSLRNRFSFHQRANISIIIIIFLFLFVLLSAKNTIIFTLKTSLFFFVTMLLLAFSRKTRDEFIKNIYEIPDVRDLEFSRRKKKNK